MDLLAIKAIITHQSISGADKCILIVFLMWVIRVVWALMEVSALPYCDVSSVETASLSDSLLTALIVLLDMRNGSHAKLTVSSCGLVMLA